MSYRMQNEYKLCNVSQTKGCVTVLTKCVKHIDKVPPPPARIMRERSPIWEYIMTVVACAVFPATVVNPFSPVVDVDLLLLGNWKI